MSEEAYLDHLIDMGEEIEMEYSKYLRQQSEELIARAEEYEIEKREYEDYMAQLSDGGINFLCRIYSKKNKINFVLEAMADADEELKNRIEENSQAYYKKYSSASAECEIGVGGENSNMTFGESFELCRGFIIQPRINDTSGPVNFYYLI